MLLSQVSGFDIWQAPPGGPEQMSSRVDYDPKLSDRFFESDEWICAYGSRRPVTCRDGKPVTKKRPGVVPPLPGSSIRSISAKPGYLRGR